jgi:predicted ArsR family transcriptional regulator
MSTTASRGPVAPEVEDHLDARERVLRSLVDQGPATAAVLADRLGITAGAVRRHLDPMVETGLLTAGEQAPYGPRTTRGRGRPARVYAVTDAGRAWLPQAYEALSVQVLRYLRTTGGDQAVTTFAVERLAEQRDRYAEALSGVAVENRPQELARLLSQEGFAATAEPAVAPAGGTQICQHHCPVAHAAVEFPELCDAETAMFSQLLGTHVQRLATLAHGDAVCTTHLPVVPATTRSAS